MILEQVLLIGLAVIVLPPLLERLHINIRAGEVITGIAVAALIPDIASAEWVSLLAEVGLVVLMFEIGLDIDLEKLKDSWKQSFLYGAFSFIVPFVVTMISLYILGAGLLTALVVATGLSATALAVVAPIINESDRESQILKNSVMISEMLGVTLLVVFVKGQSTSALPLYIQSAMILGFILFTVFLLPRIVEKLQILDSKDIINLEMKTILFIVVFIALLSENLGIHAATGAFLTGLFFSESTHRGMELEERLKPVLELFTPVFFLHIGTLIDLSMLSPWMMVTATLLALTVYASRFFAFELASEFMGVDFDLRKLSLFAPSITITSTAASIGLETGVLDPATFSAFVYAGLLLTILGPLGSRMLPSSLEITR